MSQPAAAPPGEELFCPSCSRSYLGGVSRCPLDGTALVKLAAPKADPLVGRDLDGRYTVRSQLGAGGMGTVYRAWQHSVGREVALKVISRGASEDPMMVKRFLREAKLSSRLSQPNVVTVLDFGQTSDGLLYLAMELLEGETLSRLIRDQAPLGVERAVRIGIQLCDALEAAHQLAIVHRDLKPSNVVVLSQPAGRDLLKVLDFGLARSLEPGASGAVTGSSIVLGTPNYLSPEQAMGEEVDERSDLYSLGAILFEMLTGAPPFGREGTFTEIVRRQLSGQPPPIGPSVPPALDHLVRRLLEVDRERRPRSAAMVREQLLVFAGSTSGPQPLPVAPGLSAVAATVKSPRRRLRQRAALIVGLLFGSLAVTLGVLRLLEPPPTARPPSLDAPEAAASAAAPPALPTAVPPPTPVAVVEAPPASAPEPAPARPGKLGLTRRKEKAKKVEQVKVEAPPPEQPPAEQPKPPAGPILIP